MIMGFYSGAAMLRASQSSVDIVANNLANVNTTGYQAQEQQFDELLYTSMTNLNAAGAQAVPEGSGAAVTAAGRDQTAGTLTETGRALDYAIGGTGYFSVRSTDGTVRYTRDGAFEAVTAGGGTWLADTSGNRVLDRSGNLIAVKDGQPAAAPGVFAFADADALMALGNGLFAATARSGQAAVSGATAKEGFLEGSNVDVAGAMSGLLVAQRAYSLSSRAVQTADSVAEMANNL